MSDILLLGNGEFANFLSSLASGAPQFVYKLGIVGRGYSHGEPNGWIDLCDRPLDRNKVETIIEQYRPQYVTLGGDIRTQTEEVFYKMYDDDDEVRPGDEKVIRLPLRLSRRLPSAGPRDSIATALRALESLFTSHGVRPKHAVQLVREIGGARYDIGASAGLMTPGTPVMAPDGLSAERYVEELVERTLAHLRAETDHSVRQSIAFDDLELDDQAYQGTDQLVKDLSLAPARGRVRRALVKLRPRGMDANFDPPVLLPKTLENARRAGVSLIVVDADYGVIYPKSEFIEECKRSDIAVFGVSLE